MTVIPSFRSQCGAAALTAVVAFAGAELATAQDAPGDAIVATVNGEAITQTDLNAAADEMGEQLSQMAGDPHTNLIDTLINIRLAAKAATAAELDRDPLVASRLGLVRDRELYLEYMRGQVADALTEEAARARFSEELAAFEPGEEVHVRHILVETEDEAMAIIAELGEGGDFEAIAREKSIDPGSGPNGGDLDFIARGDTVAQFEEAAFGLDVGAYTETPVESEFGWHIIRTDEKRPEQPPVFEEEARRIQAQLFTESFDQAINDLRAGATIEIVPPPEPTAPQGVPPPMVPE